MTAIPARLVLQSTTITTRTPRPLEDAHAPIRRYQLTWILQNERRRRATNIATAATRRTSDLQPKVL